MQSVPHHELHDTQGRRLYLTADERRAFIGSAATAARPVRTLCMVLHDTGCRISEALALTSESFDLSGRAVMFESLKKRRRGIYRAVPVPPTLLDTLDMVHGIREAQKRGDGQFDRRDSSTAGSGPGHGIPRGDTSRP